MLNTKSSVWRGLPGIRVCMCAWVWWAVRMQEVQKKNNLIMSGKRWRPSLISYPLDKMTVLKRPETFPDHSQQWPPSSSRCQVFISPRPIKDGAAPRILIEVKKIFFFPPKRSEILTSDQPHGRQNLAGLKTSRQFLKQVANSNGELGVGDRNHQFLKS